MSKKALLIGINYRNTRAALRGCINDVLNTKKVLQDKFDYKEENITVLTDDTPILPTRANIEQQLIKLATEAKDGDTLYFHYSGHGSFIKDFNKDESNGLDEVLLPIDYMKKGIIVDDWIFANFVCKLPKGAKVFCVLDCCHSGTGMDLKYNFQYQTIKTPSPLPQQYRPEDWKETYRMEIEKQKQQIDTLICSFSGCSDLQTSADAYINGSPQGAFTACFLDIIQQDNVRDYTLKELLKEVNCRLIMRKMTQRSQLSVPKVEYCEEKLFF